MKIIFLFHLLMLGTLASFSQSLGLMQVGSIGGQIREGSGLVLIHSVGAIASTAIDQNGQSLDQGMFVSCDLKCTETVHIENAVLGHASLTVYPNPTHSFLTIQGDLPFRSYFELYSAVGQLIEKSPIHEKRISLLNQARGIYLLRIYSQEGELRFVGKIRKD